jgi:hypothetical protein
MKEKSSSIETIIRNYIESKEKSFLNSRERTNLEKEYNKLLTIHNGEEKNYSLEHADKIYQVYQQMIITGEEARMAEARFIDAEEKLNELGAILFEATINAEISLTNSNGIHDARKSVRVSWYNGQAVVS